MVACSCLVSASSSPTVAHRMTSFSYANDTRTANTNRTVTETAIVQGPLAMDRKFMEEATRPANRVGREGLGRAVWGRDRQGRRNYRARADPRSIYRMPGLPRRDHGDHRCVKPTQRFYLAATITR